MTVQFGFRNTGDISVFCIFLLKNAKFKVYSFQAHDTSVQLRQNLKSFSAKVRTHSRVSIKSGLFQVYNEVELVKLSIIIKIFVLLFEKK